MNAYVLFFKIDSVRRIDYVIDYFGENGALGRLWTVRPLRRRATRRLVV